MERKYADRQLEDAFEKYSVAIEKYCRVGLGEAADSAADCLQEAFCIYYQRLLSGEHFENPRAFLYRTANIRVLKAKEAYFKQAKRIKSLDEAAYLAVTMEELKSDDLDYDAIKALLLSKLSESEQQLYEMKYAEEKSLKEIAAVLGIAPEAVANRLVRLRTKIKKLVEPSLAEYRKGGSIFEHNGE